MAETMTNGEKPNSQFINHLTSYPLVSDALSTYQKNNLGAKSISIFHQLYDSLASPVLPYLKTPYSVVHPYLVKADNLGDASLDKVDERFPAVKSTDFAYIKDTTFSLIHFPLKKASETKQYVYGVYGEEYKKSKNTSGADGLVAAGKAVITTEVRVAADVLIAALALFRSAKSNASEKLDAAQQNGAETVEKAKKKGHEVKANGESKAHAAKKEAKEIHHEHHHQVHHSK